MPRPSNSTVHAVVVAWLRWIPSLIVLAPLLVGAASAPSTSERIRDLSGATSFRLLDWETVQLGQRAGRLWTGLFGTTTPTANDAQMLRDYFGTQAHDPAARPATEAALERIVGDAFLKAGISRSEPLPEPSEKLFPPVLVAVTPPPNVLVIAPRTELRVIDSTVLQPMDTSEQERLEASADSNDVSSLIAPIGGIATYPSMVLDDSSPERVLTSVAHEWVHQYLIFYPLGAGYWSNQQTREINETTADMVGQEVGGQLARDLGLAPRPAAGSPAHGSGAPVFDFRAFMRETRQHTEELLGGGQVDDAEAYMRARRDEVNQHGYQIRKLNQAYFALYGSYGDGYAASPSNPIPSLLHTLRDRSPSLADFLFTVRTLTRVDQLRQVVAASS